MSAGDAMFVAICPHICPHSTAARKEIPLGFLSEMQIVLERLKVPFGPHICPKEHSGQEGNNCQGRGILGHLAEN